MTAVTAFEDDFSAFQERLRPITETDPLLWRLRDSLYNDLYYSRTGHEENRRHQLGKFSWWAWLLGKVVQSGFSTAAPMPCSVRPRFGFLFYGSHDAHFSTLLPIVRELAATEPVTAWWLALRPDQVSLLNRIGNVTCIAMDPWSKYSGRSSAHSTVSDARLAMRLQRRIAEYPGLSAEERFKVRKKNSQIIETIFEYHRWRRIWLNLFPGLPGVALFLTSESSPMAKALCDVLRESNRRVIHFLHGLPNSTHQVTYVTDLCVFSTSQKKWFQERVPKDVQVRTIGNPRLEEIRVSVTRPRERNIGEAFRLLLFSETPGSYYDRQLKRTDLALLAVGGPEQARFSLRVRPHPAESKQFLIEDLESAGIAAYEFSTGSLVEDLSWCDAAAAAFSTALLEAAVCNRICYWLNAAGFVFLSAKDLCEQGIGKLIQGANEWREEINALVKLHAAEPARITEQRLRELEIIPRNNHGWLSRLELLRATVLL